MPSIWSCGITYSTLKRIYWDYFESFVDKSSDFIVLLLFGLAQTAVTDLILHFNLKILIIYFIHKR